MLDDLPVKTIKELLDLFINHVLKRLFKSYHSLLIYKLVIEGERLLLGMELLELHELSSSVIDELGQVLGTKLVIHIVSLDSIWYPNELFISAD
jgi:hypothetical protein